MNLPLLAARNVMRNKFRTILTVLGVAIAVLAFMLLRTVLTAWNSAVEVAAKDRLASRSKVSWVVPVPKTMVDKIGRMPGITAVTHWNWFGGKDAKHKKDFFANMAVDPETVFTVHDEFHVDETQLAAWKADKNSALVGDILAKRFNWKIGEKVTLIGAVYPGEWTFTVKAIYTAKKKGLDRSQFLFHWKRINDALPPEFQEKVGWITARLAKGVDAAEMSRTIDGEFRASPTPTLTQSELEMNRGFMAAFASILTAIDVVSIVILAIMMLILGNTIAMGVRERTSEYGVLRAIGFQPGHVVAFVLGEAFTIGILGGLAGLGLGYPFINLGLGKWLEENMGGFFPTFGVTPGTALAAFGLAIVLAAVAATIPALRASRLSITDSLRRVG